MQCQSCGYALWNLYSGKCPECGAAYDVRQYAFEPGTVAFACPLCKHQHPGAGEDYLPTSAAEMTCAGCGQRIAVATMTVVPLDVKAMLRCVPWEEKSRLGFWPAWWRTVVMSVGKPVALADAIRPVPGQDDRAMPFAILTWAVAFAAQWLAVAAVLLDSLFYAPDPQFMQTAAGSILIGVLFLALITAFVMITLFCAARGADLIANTGRRDVEATAQCIYYSQGAMIFAALPLVGIPLIVVCQIIAIVNCARMLARVHRIGMLRATLASSWLLLLPMLIVVFYSLML
jgi:hypothetical protein